MTCQRTRSCYQARGTTCLSSAEGLTAANNSRVVLKALARLTYLKKLVIGETVSQQLIELLHPLCFPRLQTFGFWLPKHHSEDDFEVIAGIMVTFAKHIFGESDNFVGMPSVSHTNEQYHIST